MALKKEEKEKVEVGNYTWICNTDIFTKLFLPSLIIAME